MTMLHYGQAACTLLFTAAGSAKVEVNDQQSQTEIVETEHKGVQVGSITKQQGVYTTGKYYFKLRSSSMDCMVIFSCCFSMASNNDKNSHPGCNLANQLKGKYHLKGH